jgi:N-dimethylarginine dimethylaminohydrolase
MLPDDLGVLPISEVFVATDIAPLLGVVVGLGDTFPGAVIRNELMEIHSDEQPIREEVTRDLDKLAALLSRHGASVARPRGLDEVDQCFPRDPAMVVDDAVFILHPLNEERQGEWRGIVPLFADTVKVHLVPDELFIEGGDVALTRESLFVGLSSRTQREALDWLRPLVDREVIGIEIVRVDEVDYTPLHLDCVVQPIDERVCVIWAEAMTAESRAVVEAQFDTVLCADSREAMHLGCNFICLGPRRVLMASGSPKLEAALKGAGCEVEVVSVGALARLGGSVRCSTMPFRRG